RRIDDPIEFRCRPRTQEVSNRLCGEVFEELLFGHDRLGHPPTQASEELCPFEVVSENWIEQAALHIDGSQNLKIQQAERACDLEAAKQHSASDWWSNFSDGSLWLDCAVENRNAECIHSAG